MSFVSETKVKAVRKRHRCDGCGQHIDIGQPATRWAGLADGDFGTAIFHPECREAEVALNHKNDWRWGDDWWRLCDMEREDREWLIEERPIVAERMGIRSLLSPNKEQA